MTNKEAINELKILKEEYWDDDGYGHETKQYDDTILALDMAIHVLEQESNTWSLEDAREDFVDDVYNTLDFLPTNDEANQIIDSFDRVTRDIRLQPCEDCISRKAELDGLASIAKAKAKSDAQKALMGRVMFFTEQLPPVTPKYTDEEIDRAQAVEQAYIDKMVELTVEELKRPKGEWIAIPDFQGDETYYQPKCPFCNEEPKEYSNYCPNCGAKLIESEEV